MKKSKRGEYTKNRKKRYLRLKRMGLYKPMLTDNKQVNIAKVGILKPTKEKNMDTQYNFWITLKKGIISYVLFVIGVLISQLIGDYPQLFDLGLGAVLMMAYNFIKVKLGIKLI